MSISDPLLAEALRGVAIVSSMMAAFVLVYELARVPPLSAPLYGLRGRRRSQARTQLFFVAAEPIFAQLAGWIGKLRLTRVRTYLTELIRHAGELAGLSADELLALNVLCCASLGWAGGWLVAEAELGFEVRLAVWLLAAWLPFVRVQSAAKQRAKQLERSLPTAMDLCVLCMGAGADFPAALRFVVDELGAAHLACREELGLVLDALSLGRTRVEALSELGQRTRSVAVREFVASVCQSEEKGTPLVETLTIQSTTLRQRRSVRAEELAAQAGVKMMLPLMLLVASLLLIIFGPLFISGTGL